VKIFKLLTELRRYYNEFVESGTNVFIYKSKREKKCPTVFEGGFGKYI
jgi:hypothetical protein